MDVQRAEAAGEFLVLRQGQFLIAEEDRLVFDQGVVDFLKGLVAERLREVDPRDLRPDDRAERCDGNAFVGHGGLSFLVAARLD